MSVEVRFELTMTRLSSMFLYLLTDFLQLLCYETGDIHILREDVERKQLYYIVHKQSS